MSSAPATPSLRSTSVRQNRHADLARHDSAPSPRSAPPYHRQYSYHRDDYRPTPPPPAQSHRHKHNSYLFDTQSNSNSSPSISHNNTNISSGFQQHHHHQNQNQNQNQHSSSAHHQQHLNNNSNTNNGTTTNNNNSSNNNTNNNSLYRTLPHLYQSQSQASHSQAHQQQQTSSSTYQPHTTAGNDIPTAPYTFPPSATGLLSSLHSSQQHQQQQQTQPQISPSHSPYLPYNPYSSSANGINGHGNGNGNGIGNGNPSAFLSQGQTQGQTHYHQNGYSTPIGSRLSSYSGLKVSPPGPGAELGTGSGSGSGHGQGQAQGSNGDYLAAYELAVANAVAGNLRGQNGAGESAQYAASPLTLDHFRQYSRQTSPHRHFSLDPRSTLHTAVNTPDISPDRSAASTPGLASGAHGSHAGSTRKAKYTRSRTGCLGCRVKRVKCDEGRPECKRCVNAKRGCVYPALQDLPKATIRALAAKKRQDSGDSTGEDEISSDRKRARVSGSAGGETSVDHYMNLIDEEGNVKAAYGHQHERADMNQFNGNGNGNANAHQHPSPIDNVGFSLAPQSAPPLWAAQNHPGYGTQNDYGRIPPVSVPSYPLSAQGYSNSISSYHLNATPGYYAGGMNQFKQASTHPSGGQDQRMAAHLPHSYQQQPQQSYSTHNGTPMLDHHMKRNDYANGNTHTHHATAIPSPDDGIGSVDNGLIAQHRTSDPQYLSDISRLTSPTLKRSALVGGNAYHMREDA